MTWIPLEDARRVDADVCAACGEAWRLSTVVVEDGLWNDDASWDEAVEARYCPFCGRPMEDA